MATEEKIVDLVALEKIVVMLESALGVAVESTFTTIGGAES